MWQVFFTILWRIFLSKQNAMIYLINDNLCWIRVFFLINIEFDFKMTGYQIQKIVKYRQFHKTLQRSSYQMHWISVRFYEMGDILMKICKILMIVFNIHDHIIYGIY